MSAFRWVLYGLLASCAILTPFAAAAHSQSTPRIVFINPGKSDEFFWPAVSATMQAAADQFGFALEVHYAERDARQMIDLGSAAIAAAQPPDILILVNEFQAAGDLLRAADARGIKVLMLLNSFVGAEATAMGVPGERHRNWIGALVPDNFGAGARMANGLRRCVQRNHLRSADGKHHLLALLGDSRTPASIERTAGMEAVVAASSDLTIDRRYTTDWQTPRGEKSAGNGLDWQLSHDVVPAGIWAANDAVALGAIAAAEARGLTPGRDLCIVGLNWSEAGVELVRQGKLVLTDGGHFMAGSWAMVMVHDHLADGGGAPIGNATFQMAAIDAENVAAFIARLGDRDWRRVDFHRFTRPGGGMEAGRRYDFSLHAVLDSLQ